MKRKLPPEILDEIFKYSEPSVTNVKSFGKYMSKKTKSELLKCSNLIKTKNLDELKKLKEYKNIKCDRKDLLYAAENGLGDIVKYLVNSNDYDIEIKYQDLINNIDNPTAFKALIENYRFGEYYDYLDLFVLNFNNNKDIYKILLDNNPINGPLRLSLIYNNPASAIREDTQFIKSIVKSGRDKIIIDPHFRRTARERRNIELIRLI